MNKMKFPLFFQIFYLCTASVIQFKPRLNNYDGYDEKGTV